jgi:hypothetical protein
MLIPNIAGIFQCTATGGHDFLRGKQVPDIAVPDMIGITVTSPTVLQTFLLLPQDDTRGFFPHCLQVLVQSELQSTSTTTPKHHPCTMSFLERLPSVSPDNYKELAKVETI